MAINYIEKIFKSRYICIAVFLVKIKKGSIISVGE